MDSTLTDAEKAQRIWAEMPAQLRAEIDDLATVCSRHASGPESSESMDAIVNEWLEPYGICQHSVWNASTRRLTIEMTTITAVNPKQENDR